VTTWIIWGSQTRHSFRLYIQQPVHAQNELQKSQYPSSSIHAAHIHELAAVTQTTVPTLTRMLFVSYETSSYVLITSHGRMSDHLRELLETTTIC
jgi:hypothetical protein